MKRKNVLLAIKDFLEKHDKSSCFEVTIFAPQTIENKKISRRRSIVIVDMPQNRHTELQNFFTRNGLNESLTSIHYYENIEALTNNTQIALDDLSLDNSWRGRVLRFNTDFTLNDNGVDFEKKFLRSYYRFIISKYDGNFFARHDITPTYFSPGTSTAGFPDFTNATKEFIKYLDNAKTRAEMFGGFVDPDFDFVRVFISKDKGTPFESVKIWNEEIIPLKSLYDRIEGEPLDGVISDFNTAISHAFET